MGRIDPRTGLLVGALGVAASAAGPRAACLALGLAGLGLAASARGWGALARRLWPVAGTGLALLLLWPLAPQAATGAALRAVAASLSVLAAGTTLEWPGAVAALQGWGAPRSLVAFLVVLARHLDTLARDARQAVLTVRLRGGGDRWANLPRATAALLARLLGAALARADRVAVALELRGFTGRLAPLPRWRPRLAETGLYLAGALLAAASLAEALAWKL